MDELLKRLTKIIFPILMGVITFALVMTQPFYSLDSMLCDSVYERMNGAGDTIKLIAIDEETLAEYGPMNKWSREKCAELTELMFADEDHAPAVLAYDVMFIGEEDEASDQALADACSGNPVVTATNLVYRGTTVYNQNVLYFDELNISSEELPYEALNENVRSGFSNALVSNDGFIRTTQVSADFDGNTRYSFATEIYRAYCDETGAEISLPKVNSRNQAVFGYSGKPGEFPRFSLSDVLAGNVDMRNFQDSIVIVGAYAPGLNDAYHTPTDRGQDMYGVEINANIVRALMLGKTFRHVALWFQALAASLMVILYAYSARKMSMYPALLSLVWVVMLDIGTGFIFSRTGWQICLIYPLITAGIAGVVIFIEKYLEELNAKREILKSFEKYLAPQVIDKLVKEGKYDFKLGVERREVCVMFVDIRGFTSMSEALSPDEVAQILNEYLSVVTDCIFRHEGMLDKFIGDSAMAVFNAPGDLDDYLYKAVLAAIDIRDSAEGLGERLVKQHGRTISFGVGLNCGEAVVGNIGSDIRMDYTAIGDTVNTAARLESVAKEGEILISEALYEQLKDRIDVQFKDEFMLKGKANAVRVYNVLGRKAD